MLYSKADGKRIFVPVKFLGRVGESEAEFAEMVGGGLRSVINCGSINVGDDLNIVKRFKTNGEFLHTPGKLSP
jgi:hypothetical protein